MWLALKSHANIFNESIIYFGSCQNIVTMDHGGEYRAPSKNIFRIIFPPLQGLGMHQYIFFGGVVWWTGNLVKLMNWNNQAAPSEQSKDCLDVACLFKNVKVFISARFHGDLPW